MASSDPALTHLTALGSTANGGPLDLLDNGQRPNLFNAYFGAVRPFTYGAAEGTALEADGELMASMGSSAMLVQYPRSDLPNEGQARSLTQNFLAVEGGDAASKEPRQRLFKNAVCWLTRLCPDCRDAESAISLGLPERFVKIRHDGLLGNRHRQERIARARQALGVAPQETESAGEDVIGPYLASKKHFTDEVVRPLQAKREPVYVVRGSDAEAHVQKRYPHKTLRHVRSSQRPRSIAALLQGMPRCRRRFSGTPPENWSNGGIVR